MLKQLISAKRRILDLLPFLRSHNSNDFLVLVVDDKDFQRQMVTLLLNQLGVKSMVAENGLIATKAAARKPVSMILMDVQMPVMDGIEATKIIKQANPDIPIIALSGETGAREVQLMSQLMDDRLEKPTNKHSLAKMLVKYCSGIQLNIDPQHS